MEILLPKVVKNGSDFYYLNSSEPIYKNKLHKILIIVDFDVCSSSVISHIL